MGVSGSAGFLLSTAAAVTAGSSAALLHYAQREVAWYSFLTSLLGFVLSFGIIALIPYDVWEALMLQEAREQLPEEQLPGQVLADESWELIYWTTSLLCWLLCPVLIEFESAGDFTAAARLKTSLRRNAIWYVTYLILGAFVLVWVAMGGDHRQTGLGAWCIAASNAWGLLVSTVLMGYGLVAVPRHLWRLASPGEQLKALYCVVVRMDEARLSTQFELQDVISEGRAEVATRPMRQWDVELEAAFTSLQATLEETEQLHMELTNGARGPRDHAPAFCSSGSSTLPPSAERRLNDRLTVDDAVRVEVLAQLHYALKQAGLEAQRASCRWDDLVRRCLFLEDLEEQCFPSALELANAWQAGASCPCWRTLCRTTVVRTFYHSLVHCWLRYVRARVFRTLGCCCGFLSVTIVLGQLTMFSNGWSLSLLSLFFRSDHGFGFTQFLCMVPLGYMVCTAYWSVFRLKISGWYGLYPDHNTDPGSLLWCASILARLAAPLCYHFLLLVQVDGTAFQKMMGQMNVVPVLGKDFNQIFPCIVGFLCICNLLNVYSRLVQLCGLDALEFEWAPTDTTGEAGDLLTEGRRLVERERRRRSEDASLMEMEGLGESERPIPLRVQIARMIEDGALPRNWNAHSP